MQDMFWYMNKNEQVGHRRNDVPAKCDFDLRLVSGAALDIECTGLHTVADIRHKAADAKAIPIGCVKLLTHEGQVPTDETPIENLPGGVVTVLLDYSKMQSCLEDQIRHANGGSLRHDEEILWLRQKQLMALPESFSQHASLRTLELFNNRLVYLPATFGQLSSLELLDLSANQLKELPKSFGDLTALQTLMLQWNRLKTLPENFGQLRALQTLELCSNELTELPEMFGQLCSLQTLDLSGNQLTVLPKSFHHLAGLQTIDLSLNLLLEALPESFANPSIFPNMSMSCEMTGTALGPSRMIWFRRLINRCLNCRRRLHHHSE